MAMIFSYSNYDNAMLKQMMGLQSRVDPGVPVGMLSALNAFQGALRPYSQTTVPTWLQGLNALNVMQSSWQIPQLQTIARNVQRINDIWSPAMQAITRQQSQSWAVPQIEATVLDLIQSSCANLTRDAMVSTLAGSLGVFTNFEIPEYDLPAELPELTEEETEQLSAELSAAAENPQNWQQRMMDVIQSWKARNPIVAAFIQKIVTTVISQLLWRSLCWGAATLRDSMIREEPASKATIVCQVKQGETITVIGDAPYYYLVEVTDPDTGEYFSGYISKKSVKPAQDIDE